MAWTKVTAPTGGAPLTTADYNRQNAFILAALNLAKQNVCHLTEWATLTAPQIADGVYVMHGGSLYLNSGALAITGAPVNGRVYVRIIDAGAGTLAASFVNSAAGFAWNYAYNGFYHADGSQLLPYVLYKYGANYYKLTTQKSLNIFDITSRVPYESMDNSIGAWNMDLSVNKALTNHNILNGFYSVSGLWELGKRLEITVKIRDDTGDFYSYNLFISGADYIYESLGVFYIILTRETGGFFDSVAFDDAVLNRGIFNFRLWI